MPLNSSKPIWNVGNLRALFSEVRYTAQCVDFDVSYSRDFIESGNSPEDKHAFSLSYDAALKIDDADDSLSKGIRGNALASVGKVLAAVGGAGVVGAVMSGAVLALPVAALAALTGGYSYFKGHGMRSDAADELMSGALSSAALLKKAVSFRENLPAYQEARRSQGEPQEFQPSTPKL